jgi:glycosyltransferase involved in cell wall biosynthesis
VPAGAPRLALTTDWLNSFGGAERVLHELLAVWPGAPIYTSVHDPVGLPAECRGWDVRPSFLQRVPGARRRHRALLPLMPYAFESFDLSAYDVVLTAAHACAKGVIAPPHVRTLCYCYTPPRYLWDQYHELTRGVRGRAAVAALATRLRGWDRAAADRIDLFVAISETVAARVRRYYRREPVIVYPPVDTRRFAPDGRPPDDYLLVVARLVPNKRVDLAVQAASRLGRRLLVVGDGPERRRLEAMAGPTVRFLGIRPDAELAGLYARARAFLFPGLDDFGIAPVEAQAAGRPVVAFGRGGATETVRAGSTGLFFDEPSADALAAAIEALDRHAFDPAECRRNAERFDAAVFRRRMAEVVDYALRSGRPAGAALDPAAELSAGGPGTAPPRGPGAAPGERPAGAATLVAGTL